MRGGEQAGLAIIGGSGLYALTGLEQTRELHVETPFGPHSDGLWLGRLDDIAVAFLARHGRDHALVPGEINYRANLFALKTLGVERIVSASAVGSMREAIRPRDVVLVDQFIERAPQREASFFDGGVAAHVSWADPVCPVMHRTLRRATAGQSCRSHERGTYLSIAGPAFSSRAESRLYRSWDVDVIGMTNAAESKLAREAEICYATIALVTDYDCWHEDEEDVSVAGLLDNLRANAATAAALIRTLVRELPADRSGCSCGDALRHAIITAPAAISPAARRRLAPILGRYLDPAPDS